MSIGAGGLSGAAGKAGRDSLVLFLQVGSELLVLLL